MSWIKPSRLVPEIEPAADDEDPLEMGPRRLLVNGIRIAAHPDGRVDRADERFDSGAVRWLALPPRMGRGFLFFQADSQGTRLWRAAGWTDSLKPLAQLGATADEIIVGFDRLYVRVEGSNRLLAIDGTSGRIVSLGSLPAAASLGAMSFSDGWRAIVDTDLRGPLATFDAGSSWHRVPVVERLQGAAVEDGDPVVYVPGGRYRLSAAGHLQFVGRSVEEESEPPAQERAATVRPTASPFASLGPRPLRTVVLSGWPDGTSTAVVARHGTLMRVRLPEGTVLEQSRTAFPEAGAECTGARVGSGFGFICGEADGPTAIYRFEPPLQLRRVARFAGPRFVAPSNNGALVVRGSCADQPPATAEAIRTYCIIGRDGARREVGVRGDLGAERVVALEDGRVVVLVPPRTGAPGRLTVIDGDALHTVKLSFRKQPRKSVRLAKRGLWLDGFQQRGEDGVGGWVEAGGPLLGVAVSLDGSVTLGKSVEGSRHALAAGPFALVVDDSDVARETTDGGQSWLEFDLPSLPESKRDSRSRACSPVGFAVRGWVRVGWGEPARADDLELAEVPEAAYVRSQPHRAVRAACRLDGPAGAAGGATEGRTAPDDGVTRGDWRAFHGRPPPVLGKGELGTAKGTSSYDPVPAHVYVWGPKGADWSRAGWWTARFRDRFDPSGRVVSSSRTRCPWGDQATASEAVGARSRGGYWRWAARLDPSGRSALLSTCRGSACRLYAVTEGRPILPLRDEAGRADLFRTPLAQGAVRLGESWFFITDTGRDELDLWRSELGIVQRLSSFRRLDRRRYGAPSQPRLVRRAVSRDLGLLVTVPGDPSTGGGAASWVVLPIDPASGTMGQPVLLGPADLEGRLPPRCRPEQDGWLVDGPLDGSVVLSSSAGQSYLDSIEFRLRLAPGNRCVEAIAARTGRSLRSADDGNSRSRRSRSASGLSGDGVPLAVRAQSSASRWKLWCEPSERSDPSRVEQLLRAP